MPRAVLSAPAPARTVVVAPGVSASFARRALLAADSAAAQAPGRRDRSDATHSKTTDNTLQSRTPKIVFPKYLRQSQTPYTTRRTPRRPETPKHNHWEQPTGCVSSTPEKLQKLDRGNVVDTCLWSSRRTRRSTPPSGISPTCGRIGVSGPLAAHHLILLRLLLAALIVIADTAGAARAQTSALPP